MEKETRDHISIAFGVDETIIDDLDNNDENIPSINYPVIREEVDTHVKDLVDIHKDFKNQDYIEARKTLIFLLSKSQGAIDKILQIAGDNINPGAFKIAAELIKNTSVVAKDLIELQKIMNDVEKSSSGGGDKTKTVDGKRIVYYVGTTAELAEELDKPDEK
jgi:hypothetical protein